MPEKDQNNQEGPDTRNNLIKINVGGDTVFVNSNQYKPKKDIKPKKRLTQKCQKILNRANGGQKIIVCIK